MSALISIIMPVLDEEAVLEECLQSLQVMRKRGHEVVVVDGGSTDGSVAIARRQADKVIETGRGRALQMNAGSEHASHDILLFLHADTRLPELADELIVTALEPHAAQWGRFDLRLSNPAWIYRLIALSINWRSALSGIATGDQAMFVRRNWFARVHGFDAMPLMEDVALSKKLLHFAWPARVTTPVISNSRKWEQEGVMRTILLMWFLRAAFFFGVSPTRLRRLYYRDKPSA